MSGSNWFLHRNGQQFGPYTWEQLVQLARSNHVDATDLVWREGDAGSRHASEIPGLLPAASAAPATTATPIVATGTGPTRNRGLIAGLAVGVAALAVALVVVLVTRGGGDDASSSPDTTEEGTTEPSDTKAPSTTVKRTTTTEVPATTLAPTTAAPVTTIPLTTMPTTAAPTTLPIASEADLVDALPPADDLPMGWAVDDGGVTTDLDPHTGQAYGACGLGNNDARAQEAGAVAHAEAPEFYLPDNGYFYVTLLSFPTVAEAEEFFRLTEEQSSQCQSGFEFDIVEGDGPDQFDMFYGNDFDGLVWHVTETDTPLPLSGGVADQRYSYGYVTTFNGADGSHPYSVTWNEIDQYERYGNIVLITELYGSLEASGFSSWDMPFYEVTQQVLMDSTDEIRDGVLTRLENLGFWN